MVVVVIDDVELKSAVAAPVSRGITLTRSFMEIDQLDTAIRYDIFSQNRVTCVSYAWSA
jgi:hypothetical protein